MKIMNKMGLGQKFVRMKRARFRAIPGKLAKTPSYTSTLFIVGHR